MIALPLLLAALSSTPVGFIDDYDLALERAKTEKKPIVADFSGSDWCFWCQRLDKEVFSQESFIAEATNKYVLLMIDRPRDKSVLSEKAKAENGKLVRKYKVNSFPTVLILDEEGKILGETGFVGGGPENYLKHLEEKIALAPYYREWMKPLIRRVNGFYRRFSAEMTAAEDKKATQLRLANELEELVKAERAKEVPSEIAVEWNRFLDETQQGVESLRR